MAEFDDQPQWYWAASNSWGDDATISGDRAVIACGQASLWRRSRQEMSDNDPAWDKFGPPNGDASLADCMYVFLNLRENHGVNYNRLTLELAQVPAWARFIKNAKSDLGNWISNPSTSAPLLRESYSREIEQKLGSRIAQTLNLDPEWWL